MLAEPITRLVYERGEFDADSTDLVAEALFWFSFSLPFAGANLLLTRTFFSLQRPWLPTALGGATLVINAVVALALYKPFGIGGIVFGTAVASAAMTVGAGVLPAPRARRQLEGGATLAAVVPDPRSPSALLARRRLRRCARRSTSSRALAAGPARAGRRRAAPRASPSTPPRCCALRVPEARQMRARSSRRGCATPATAAR